MLNYRDGKVTQKIGTLSLYNLEGDFAKAVEYLQKECNTYKKDYVDKAGVIFDDAGVYADSDMKKHGGAYALSEKRSYRFNRIYLDVNTVYEYGCNEGTKELQVWGERDISPEEQAALDKTKKASQAEQDKIERAEFERLKARFEK